MLRSGLASSIVATSKPDPTTTTIAMIAYDCVTPDRARDDAADAHRPVGTGRAFVSDTWRLIE